MPAGWNILRLLYLLVLLLSVCALLPLFPGCGYDSYCWQSWSTHIYRNGLSHAYTSDTNYLPFYQYVLWAYGKLAGSEAAIHQYYPYLRCFTLLFECWGIWLVCKWCNRKQDFIWLLTLCLLNVGYSYNTIIWGQVDAIGATLIFASLYAAWRRSLLWSGLLLVLAVNMKLQAVIFLPLWVLLLLDDFIIRKSWRHLLAIAGITIAVQALLLLPFSMAGIDGVKPLWNILRNASRMFPQLSMNAYNLWYWVALQPTEVGDAAMPVRGLSYKAIGLLLFMVLSLLACIPLLKVLWGRWRMDNTKYTPISRILIWLTAAQIGLLFFFCNTQMHERYVHPALIFITAYALYTRRWAAYLLCSVAYLLNMEGVLNGLGLAGDHLFLFDARFVAALYALLLVYLFAMFYKWPIIIMKRSAQVDSEIPAISASPQDNQIS
jgi:Gpi18-like mannosyltransferase